MQDGNISIFKLAEIDKNRVKYLVIDTFLIDAILTNFRFWQFSFVILYRLIANYNAILFFKLKHA